jgi:hypothetical protein
VKSRNRRPHSHVFEGYICTFLTVLLIGILFLPKFNPFPLYPPNPLFHNNNVSNCLNSARDFFLIIILCFGLACAWMVLARPIVMNWLGSRSGDDGYMMYIMDG